MHHNVHMASWQEQEINSRTPQAIIHQQTPTEMTSSSSSRRTNMLLPQLTQYNVDNLNHISQDNFYKQNYITPNYYNQINNNATSVTSLNSTCQEGIKYEPFSNTLPSTSLYQCHNTTTYKESCESLMSYSNTHTVMPTSGMSSTSLMQNHPNHQIPVHQVLDQFYRSSNSNPSQELMEKVINSHRYVLEDNFYHPMESFDFQLSNFAYRPNKSNKTKCNCPNCIAKENDTFDNNSKRQHICHVPGCGKVYNKTSHLKAHIRTHNGERPYTCNWPNCNKKFTRSDELQRHYRTHTGVKKYSCAICYKKFMRRDHLGKHTKIHEKENNKS